MENIKNLTPEELVELVHTWCEANKEKRAIIVMAGQDEEGSFNSTQCVSGKGLPIGIMLADFIKDNSKLLRRATAFSLVKEIMEKENSENKESE